MVTPSLKWRLVWILLALILFTWLASAVVLYFSSDDALEVQIDDQLHHYSHMVMYISRVFAHQIDEGLPLYESWKDNPLEELRQRPMVVARPEDGELTPAVNIWLNDKLIAEMAGSPRFEKPTKNGFYYQTSNNGEGRWRLFSHYDAVSELWIVVAIEVAPARRSMLATLVRGLLPLLIVLPLTLMVVYFGVSRGLAPLHTLVRQIARRKPGQLDAMQTAGVPAEVAGVVNSINQLMERLAFALEAEQRFTANAAHELTTPLAAIKAEVQLCQRQLHGSAAAGMLSGIVDRVDRASHTVEQLLTLARLDPEVPMECLPVPLRALLTEVLAETGHLAAARDIAVDFKEGPECIVSGNEEALAILLRNLLVNAFHYATPGTTVQITLGSDEAVHLMICNECAPLSPDEFRQISHRFYRVPGTDSVGSGLGLSIVERIAALHEAQFSARPKQTGDGFCVSLRFRR
ncbi:MAG: histidine kinase dimerization/phospho-acceptor domain-containing protein [Halioglobus sp.]